MTKEIKIPVLTQFIEPATADITIQDLENPNHPINAKYISGKRDGAGVKIGEDIYVAQGSKASDAWIKVGGSSSIDITPKETPIGLTAAAGDTALIMEMTSQTTSGTWFYTLDIPDNVIPVVVYLGRETPSQLGGKPYNHEAGNMTTQSWNPQTKEIAVGYSGINKGMKYRAFVNLYPVPPEAAPQH